MRWKGNYRVTSLHQPQYGQTGEHSVEASTAESAKRELALAISRKIWGTTMFHYILDITNVRQDKP